MCSISRPLLTLRTPIDPASAQALRAIHETAERLGLSFCVIGASARDIVLSHVYGIQTKRATKDFDLALTVDTWDQYSTFVDALMQTGQFRPGRLPHELSHSTALPVDIVPFGRLEDPQGRIRWPDDPDTVMSTIGLAEAFDSAVLVEIAGGLETPVASLPGQAILKLIAWIERHLASDTQDLYLLMTQYVEAGNQDRLYELPPDAFEGEDFDYVTAGVYLLGEDIAEISSRPTINQITETLSAECDAEGPARLAHTMARDPGGAPSVDLALDYLQVLLRAISK